MIQAVLITTSSGMLVYHKAYPSFHTTGFSASPPQVSGAGGRQAVNPKAQTVATQPRLVASLLTAITEFSMRTLGMRPLQVRLNHQTVCLAYSVNPDSPAVLSCAVFLDPEDGIVLGKFLAQELLGRFLAAFVAPARSSQQQSSAMDTLFWNAHMPRFAAEFGSHVPDCLRACVRSLLIQLVHHARGGVRGAVLVAGPRIVFSTMALQHTGVAFQASPPTVLASQGSDSGFDGTRLVAALGAMRNMGTDVLAPFNDAPRDVVFAGKGGAIRIFSLHAEEASLVVLYRASAVNAESAGKSTAVELSLRATQYAVTGLSLLIHALRTVADSRSGSLLVPSSVSRMS
eukprot:ANDGO_06759.mRNA.1 hypothetical protein H257_17746